MTKPKTDPLIRAAKAAYRTSNQRKLDCLLSEEAKWKRRHTIAVNKLACIRRQLNDFTAELVKLSDTKAP